MSMGTAQYFGVQHAGQTDIRSVLGATGDFIHPIMPNWTGADNPKFMLLCFHAYLLGQP
jgi:hypothetical protein